MHRVDTPDAAGALPTINPPGTAGFFTQGSPSPAVPATVPGQDFFNMIQEELNGAVELVGLTPDQTKVNFTQLAEAIQRVMNSRALIVHELAEATQGGNLTANTWNVRPLTSITYDPYSIVSIASNQFTLQAGTYSIIGASQGFAINTHKARIRNVTDNITAIVGLNANSTDIVGDAFQTADLAWVRGIFTIAAAKTFEFQHWAEQTNANNGLGSPVVGGHGEVAVYAFLEINQLF